MSPTAAATGGEEDPIGEAFADAARVLVPLARMYLGPAVGLATRDGDATGSERDLAAAERRILLLALNKLVIEAGALPAPGTAYAPHTTAFTIDPETRMGTALDLGYVLAAMRGLASWAAAGPAPAAAAPAEAAATGAHATAASSFAAPPASARDVRMALRGRATVEPATRAVPASRRGGGCGCKGAVAVAPTAARAPRRAARKPDCRDPRPHCDCGMSCGGRGCGCNGRTSCTDCIPRGAPPADRCSCGTCPPKPPEACEPWTPSCETRNRLRACLKDILCELLLCFEQALCKGGQLDPAALRQWRQHLNKCFADLFCRLLRCLREAICPPPVECPPALPPAPIDCLPCSYAVEDSR